AGARRVVPLLGALSVTITQAHAHRQARHGLFFLLLTKLDGVAVAVDDFDAQAQRLQLLDQDPERFRDARLLDRLALDDGFVGLDAPGGVVRLDGHHFLERVCRTVSLQRPHFHFAKALAAELRFTAERLLRDQRVRSGRTG